MAYINFNEEKKVCINQLEKRKKNNENLFNEIMKDKKLAKDFTPYEKFSYKVFNGEFFGKKDIESEENFLIIENKDVVCTKFIDCKFYNVKFRNCKFIGNTFTRCNFGGGGVVFDNCTFIKEDTEKLPTLNKEDNFSTEFNECSLYVKFINCSIQFIIFEKCYLKDTTFEQCNMSNGIIINSELNMIIIKDTNLSGIKVMKSYIKDLEFRDLGTSKLDEKSFFDKIPIRKKDRNEYEGLYMVYQNIADKFKENNLKNNFGEYYYICNNMKRKTLKPIPKIVSYLYWLSCGYGERPWYALIFSLILSFIFAILYLFCGIEVDGYSIRYTIITLKEISFSNFIKDFNEAINLSIGIFGGVGYNNAQPTEISYMVENIETVIGVVMMGVGIGCLTRKIVR